MTETDRQVILITGASSGLGRAGALHLAELGHQVFGTSRAPDAEARPFDMLAMDVTDDESVRCGVSHVLDAAGRIDVVINNAGGGIGAAIEETALEDVEWLFDLNVLGVLRVCQAVLPAMRAQGAGKIINMSSIGGVIGLPFQGIYSATKFAIEGLSEALRIEVRPFGIHVVLVEPGDFSTPFTANRRRDDGALDGSAYRPALERALAVVEAEEQGGFPPEAIGPVLARIVADPAPRLRYQAGAASQRLAALSKRVLPAGLFEAIIRGHYRVG